MRKNIYLTRAELLEEKLILHSSERFSEQHLKPAGQVIVDSDNYSFVYLAESDEDYVLLHIQEGCWTALKEGFKQNIPVVANLGETTFELEGLHHELDYLIENIEGNSNYGDEMVKKVESVFLEKAE
ncbi:hypothetical protein FZC84_18455 [Rossellomorea vietnamensis]|uniref:UPF0738 protein FZC84_18455 n=1 Tax=Rossellomorea vietnamensis TaxID=218284 RepID=A0A5D4M813_9BACI|nr:MULTISPECIES: hypothetical protein [Bacillaceae]TYR97661.1 hypothetical protein FZC84_18455 [Rossellomorea vietnamensis]